MSAIWGAVSFALAEGMEGGVRRMREPYETKCKVDRIHEVESEVVYMGCAIQHVSPLAHLEELPLQDTAQKLWLTADAILDNRDQLSTELELEESLPDGTLIAMAYRKWGIDCLKHFRGLYSFAIYDEKENALYLAADQTAGRCLYYFQKSDRVFFSTLLQPILTCEEEISYHKLFFQDFLLAPGLMPGVMSAETPYEGVYKLNPGTYVKFTAGQRKEFRYWHPDMPLTDCKCRTAEEYGLFFRRLYTQCVEEAMHTPGEVGIAMSSGLDSASVGALAATELAKEGKTLYTYTYVPHDREVTGKNQNLVVDEREGVEKIAQAYPNMKLHFLNHNGKNAYEELDRYLDILEIPFKAFVNIPCLYEIYEEAAKQGCSVVLTGQMGNSTVSNGHVKDVFYDLYVKRHFGKLMHFVNQYCKHEGIKRTAFYKLLWHLFRQSDDVLRRGNRIEGMDNPFLQEEAAGEYPMQQRYQAAGMPYAEGSIVSQKVYREYCYWQTVYAYLGEVETKLGLACNVVIRDPTRDSRLLQFCYQLPYEYYAWNGIPRWLIRGNMQDLLPKDLLEHWQRYGVQNADWAQRIWRDWGVVMPDIQRTLQEEGITEWIRQAEAEQYLHTCKNTEEKDEGKLCGLICICIVKKYLKKFEKLSNKIDRNVYK